MNTNKTQYQIQTRKQHDEIKNNDMNIKLLKN